MKLKWLGHASFAIKAADKIIYIDPYAGEPEDYNEKADIILVSHEHYDHFSQEKIKQIHSDHTIILSNEHVVKEIHTAERIKPGEEKIIDRVKIKAVHAYNPRKKFHPKGECIGFLIEAESKTIFFAGDTDIIPEHEEIKADIVLLPVGGNYTMSAKEAVETVKQIQPKIAIPMHFGTIVGSLDDAELFKELVEEQTNTKVEILKPGEVVEF